MKVYFLIGSFAAGEIPAADLEALHQPVRRAEGHPAHSRFSRIDLGFIHVSFLRPRQLLLSGAGGGAVLGSLPDREIAHRADLPCHPLYGTKLSESVGVDAFRYRMLAVVAAFFAGLAGALYAHYLSTTSIRTVRRQHRWSVLARSGRRGAAPHAGMWPDLGRGDADHHRRGHPARHRRRSGSACSMAAS